MEEEHLLKINPRKIREKMKAPRKKWVEDMEHGSWKIDGVRKRRRVVQC